MSACNIKQGSNDHLNSFKAQLLTWQYYVYTAFAILQKISCGILNQRQSAQVNTNTCSLAYPASITGSTYFLQDAYTIQYSAISPRPIIGSC